MTGWASDGVISPPEKLTLKQEAKDLASEKVEIIANAGKYGIATTGYVNAYNAYLGELNYHSTATPENIAIRTTFATYQTAYYNARQSILDQIAAKTKQNAQDYADNVGKTISASLNIEKGRIDTLAGKFDANGKLIEGAGWITTTQGNTWYAGKSLENGQNIISYINQTPGNTVINSNRINLVGAVSFSMLSDYTSVNNRINGKASMSDVTNALSNYVTNSGLNSKLSSYALASTLSNYVQSATLTSTLKNYATNTAAGDAANSAATAEFKKLANALVNGTTSVIGGFISTKAIDTDSIYANMASIGGLRIEDGGLFSERYTTGYSSSKFFLYSKGDDAFLGFSASNVWAGIGLNVFPSTIDGTALGRFETWYLTVLVLITVFL